MRWCASTAAWSSPSRRCAHWSAARCPAVRPRRAARAGPCRWIRAANGWRFRVASCLRCARCWRVPVDEGVIGHERRPVRRLALLVVLLLAVVVGVAGYRWASGPDANDDSVVQALSTVADATNKALLSSHTPDT